MKRKIWISVLLVLATIFGLSAFAACKNKKDEGEETGVYYYDGGVIEYDISLNSGNKFAFLVKDANESGEYKLDGEKLTLKFSKKDLGSIEATLKDGVISLVYENSSMRFLKKTLYTVSFNSMGGSDVESQLVLNGKTLAKPADPVLEGKVLVGWYKDEELTTPFMFGTEIVSSDLTLYARWGNNFLSSTEFTVDFDLGYEATAPEAVQTAGGKLYDVPTPTREGYIFNGWWISMYDDASKLTSVWREDTVFEENTTLHAKWERGDLGRKLASPQVWVSGNTINMLTQNANTYTVAVEGPQGATPVASTPVSATSFSYDFANNPAGDYVITVTATSPTSADNSEPTVSYYRNKALTRVSLFEVVTPATLLFNDIAGAKEYYVDVECGDANHQHNPFYNGKSTYFNFANCAMREGGIRFTVTARADGYLDSVSRTFIYDRSLTEVTEIKVEDEILTWHAVPEATNYIITISRKNGEIEQLYDSIDNGVKTSYDLREYGRGDLTINIYPRTRGFNSPVPTTFTYHKTSLAAPSGFRLVDSKLYWEAVEDATEYTVIYGDKTFSTGGETSCDLEQFGFDNSEILYTLTVIARDSDSQSPESKPVDLRYYYLAESLTYSRSVLSWTHVYGATRYGITVNDGAEMVVTDGQNAMEITLTQRGTNKISIRFFDNNLNQAGSERVIIEVYAYSIEFDTRGAKPIPTQYKAYGDKIDLPTPEFESADDAEGKTFGGWYNAPGGAESNGARFGNAHNDADRNLEEYFTESGDIVLYAYWAPAPTKVNYVYGDERDQDPNVPHEAIVYYNRSYQLEAPEAIDGSVGFQGWFTEETGGVQLTDGYGASRQVWKTSVEEMTIYARWPKILNFTLVNDAYYVEASAHISLVDTVTIPAKYGEGENEKLVKSISISGFAGARTLVSINIPDTITYIGDDAFRGCTNLKEINVYETEGLIPQSNIKFRSTDGVLSEYTDIESGSGWVLKVYPSAKSGAYTIPDYVNEIYIRVFSNTAISSVIVPASVSLVATSAFENCPRLTSVTFLSSTASSARLDILDSAFLNCPMLKTVTLPSHLRSFAQRTGEGNGVFTSCPRLTDVIVDGFDGAGAGYGTYGFSSLEGMLISSGALVFCPDVKATGKFTVPAGVNFLADYLFYRNTTITEVEIPRAMQGIGSRAFYHCENLTKVVFTGGTNAQPGLLDIGIEAFYDCDRLTTVTFEENCRVKNIQENAFADCRMLTAMHFPATLEVLGNGAVSRCIRLSEVTFADSNTNLKLELGDGVFARDTELREITLPARISLIRAASFSELDNLTGVHITNNAKSTTYESDNGAIYLKNPVELVFWPKSKGGDVILRSGVVAIGEGAFSGNTRLTSITIPSSVTTIGSKAFEGCSNLSSVTFLHKATDSITFEGERTFANCGSLIYFSDLPQHVTSIPNGFMAADIASKGVRISSFTIPKDVTSIGSSAFAYARIGTYLFDGVGVSEIGASAFAYTTMTSIDIPRSVKTIGANAFYHSSVNTVKLSAGSDLTSIGDSAFEGSGLTGGVSAGTGFAFVLSNGKPSANLETIGSRAFYGVRLSAFAMPETVKEIKSEAFASTGLTSVSLPESVKKVGESAFANSQISGNGVTLNGNFEEFGTGVFAGCTALTGFILNEGVTVIPSNLIGGTGVTSFTVPRGVTKIDKYAFAGAPRSGGSGREASPLENLTFEANSSLKEIGDYAFFNCSALRDISLPVTVTSIGAYAFQGCVNFRNFLVPAPVTSIGDYAFADNSSLGTFSFGTTGTKARNLSIGNFVFNNCVELESVVLPNYVSEIGNNIFNNCIKLTNFQIEAGNNNTYETRGSVLYKNIDNGLELMFCLPAYDATDGTYGVDGVYTVPRNVVVIDNSAFSGTKIRKIVFEANGTYPLQIGSYDNVVGRVVASDPEDTQSLVFFGSEALEEVTLPERLTVICGSAFRMCTSLQKINIPASVELIGADAFYGCSSLTSLTFDGVSNSAASRLETIGFQAFRAVNNNDIGLNTAIVLPNSVKTIGAYAFQGTGITKITIPASVETIEGHAFRECKSLASVEFTGASALTTIGANAFQNTGLISIKIPGSVEGVMEYAFDSCAELRQVQFDNSNNGLYLGHLQDGHVEGYPAYVFANCTQLTAVTLPERLNSAGMYLFYNCRNLKSIEIPQGLTILDSYSFYNCENLTNITFRGDIQELRAYSLAGCGFEELTIPKSVIYMQQAFRSCLSLKKVTFASEINLSNNGGIGASAFNGCTELTSVVFGSGASIGIVGDGAFQNCSSLETFPFDEGGIYSIGSGAFQGTALTDITLTNIKVIGSSAFSGLTTLKSVTFGSEINSIGSNAFASVLSYDAQGRIDPQNSKITGLTSVTFNANTPALSTLDDGAFQNCQELTQIILPEIVGYIGSYVFGGCTKLKVISVPINWVVTSTLVNSDTGVEEYRISGSATTFQAIGGVLFSADGTELLLYPVAKKAAAGQYAYVLDGGVKAIGEGAFYNAQYLTSISLNNGLEEIGNSAFRNTPLTAISFPGTVQKFGANVLAGCTQLKQITFARGITAIPDSMFSGCTNLTSVEIPEGIAYIGAAAFSGTQITEITIPASVKEIGASAFASTPLASITFASRRNATLLIGASAFARCSALKEIVLPEGATFSGTSEFTGNAVAGTGAFADCSGLESVTLPSSVTTIENSAFENCTNVTKFVIADDGANLTAIGSRAFRSFGSRGGIQNLDPETGLKITGNVVEIPEQAFASSGFSALSIPGSVVSVGSSAFSGMSNLKSITFLEGSASALTLGDPTQPYNWVFQGCGRLETVEFAKGRGLIILGMENFAGCTSLTTVHLSPTMENIPDGLFQNLSSLKNVDFGQDTTPTLESIGKEAFAGTSGLEGIDLPNGLTQIGEGTFRNSGIKTVDLPSTLAIIGDSAFENCERLTTLTIPNSVTSIGARAFYGNSALTSVQFGTNTGTIGDRAFENCGQLTTISETEAVTILGSRAFAGCSQLGSAEFVSVSSMGAEAFMNCASLTSVIFENIATIPDGAFQNCSQLNSTSFSGIVSSIGARAFYNCAALSGVVIDLSVTSLGASAFQGCTSLQSIAIPDNVSVLSASLFEGCTSLKEVTMNCSPISVGNRAFYRCVELTSIDLKSGLASLGEEAFYECIALTGINLKDTTVREIGNYTFYNCSTMTTAELPDTVEKIGDYAFSGCTGILEFMIPANVQELGVGALQGITNLKIGAGSAFQLDKGVLYRDNYKILLSYNAAEDLNFTIRQEVVEISRAAFGGSKVQSITVAEGGNLRVIGERAFENCAELTSVNLNNATKLDSLGQRMFSGCTQLTAFEVPASVSDLGAYVFSGSSITTITIPETVTRLGDYVFEGSGFTSITIPETVKAFGDHVFENSKLLTSVTFASGTELSSLGNYTFAGCTSLNDFSFLETLTNLTAYGDYMFSGCTSITTFAIPANIKELGEGLFSGCTSLTNVTFASPTTDRKIPNNFFENCTALESFEVPDWVTTIGSYAFSGSGLVNFTLPINVTVVGDYAFANTALARFEVTDAITSTVNQSAMTGRYLFSGLKSSEFTLVLPSYIKGANLGEYMFAGLAAETFTLNLSDDIDYMGNYTFSRSTAVKEVTINGKIYSTTNPVEAGYPTWNHTWVWIDDNRGGQVKERRSTEADQAKYPTNSVGNMFEYCTALTKVTFPDTLEKIMAKTFLGCTSLEKYAIPRGVTYLGTQPFNEATNLKEIWVPSSVERVDLYGFGFLDESVTVYIEGGFDQTVERDALGNVVRSKWYFLFDDQSIFMSEDDVNPGTPGWAYNYRFDSSTGTASNPKITYTWLWPEGADPYND